MMLPFCTPLHTLHTHSNHYWSISNIFVRNVKIPISVTQAFDRNGICIKLQRRWYKICVRTRSRKWFKYRMNNRLSAKISLFQTLSFSVEHDLVTGSLSYRILQFRTGRRSDWLSNKNQTDQIWISKLHWSLQ